MSQPVDPALDALRYPVGRFKAVTGADARTGLHHPERGPMTLGAQIQLYAWHSRHHAAHIANLKTAKGRP